MGFKNQRGECARICDWVGVINEGSPVARWRLPKLGFPWSQLCTTDVGSDRLRNHGLASEVTETLIGERRCGLHHPRRAVSRLLAITNLEAFRTRLALKALEARGWSVCDLALPEAICAVAVRMRRSSPTAFGKQSNLTSQGGSGLAKRSAA